MRVGGVELIDGKIVELIIDSVATVPAFDPAKAGEFTFSLDDNVLRFNSGENLVPLNTTVSENPNLIASLGANWLNNDLSFNPVPFNDLDGISGLDSNDSLFNVVDQLTMLINSLTEITLLDITVAPGLPNLGVVSYIAEDLVIVDIETVLAGSSISLSFDNLRGFNITDVTDGNIIAFDTEGDLTSRTAHYRYEMIDSNLSHLISHNLGEQYVSVFCIDPATSKLVIPADITFSTDTQCIIDLDESHGLIALITNMPRPTLEV